jgi:hypothetical protein
VSPRERSQLVRRFLPGPSGALIVRLQSKDPQKRDLLALNGRIAELCKVITTWGCATLRPDEFWAARDEAVLLGELALVCARRARISSGGLRLL